MLLQTAWSLLTWDKSAYLAAVQGLYQLSYQMNKLRRASGVVSAVQLPADQTR